MNRRHLMQLAAAASLGVDLPAIREERGALKIAESIHAHMIVSAHGSEKSAERFRRKWIGQPFEGLGEFYRDSTTLRELPADLNGMQGTLTFHTTTIGVAAERRNYLVGAFRRENIAVIVRIIGDHENLMFSITEHIASQSVPTTFEILWHPIHLRKFIPSSEDLGQRVEPGDAAWP